VLSENENIGKANEPVHTAFYTQPLKINISFYREKKGRVAYFRVVGGLAAVESCKALPDVNSNRR
jgi:hypothetical protein